MRCAVVDAYGIGRFLPGALRQYGVEPIHVRSLFPDVHLEYRPGDFTIDLQHDGDIDATAAQLRALGVEFVVAAMESGVLLADALSAALGTPGNGMRRPAARRNKAEMVAAVGAAGLAVADSLASASADEVVAWAAERDEWPVVLKPVASAGMDNVHFCHSAQDIRVAHARILNDADRYGQRNEVALAQQFLHGDEHFVNTVSRDGVHHIVEIWRYHKHQIDSTRSMVSNEHPIPMDDPAARAVGAYTLAVLDALEVRNGAAHTEVMLTKEGPVLVECGARLGGAHLPDLVSRSIGTNQVDRLALAIARPSEITGGTRPGYQLLRPVRFLNLIVARDGVIPTDDGWAPVRALPSFLELIVTQPAGKRIEQTVDLASSPGYVYLSADDPAQVEADYQRLRDLERDGLYAPPPSGAVPPEYRHEAKAIVPADDLVLARAQLKWYDIHLADRPTAAELRDEARAFLRAETEAGRLEFRDELGYAMLHLDGDGYFLLVCVWRNANELWQTLYGHDDNGFQPYPAKSGALKPTQNVFELDATSHERRAWSRYLSSARDEAARVAYLADRCTGKLV